MSMGIWVTLTALGILLCLLALAADVPLVVSGKRWLRLPWYDSNQVVTRSMRERALISSLVIGGLLLALVGRLLDLLDIAQIASLALSVLGLLVMLLGFAIRFTDARRLFKDDENEDPNASLTPR